MVTDLSKGIRFSGWTWLPHGPLKIRGKAPSICQHHVLCSSYALCDYLHRKLMSETSPIHYGGEGNNMFSWIFKGVPGSGAFPRGVCMFFLCLSLGISASSQSPKTCMRGKWEIGMSKLSDVCVRLWLWMAVCLKVRWTMNWLECNPAFVQEQLGEASAEPGNPSKCRKRVSKMNECMNGLQVLGNYKPRTLTFLVFLLFPLTSPETICLWGSPFAKMAIKFYTLNKWTTCKLTFFFLYGKHGFTVKTVLSGLSLFEERMEQQ